MSQSENKSVKARLNDMKKKLRSRTAFHQKHPQINLKKVMGDFGGRGTNTSFSFESSSPSQANHSSALFAELALAWGTKLNFDGEHVNGNAPATRELMHISHNVRNSRYAMLLTTSGVNVRKVAPLMCYAVTWQRDGVRTDSINVLHVGLQKLRLSLELFPAQKPLCIFLLLGFLCNRLWVHSQSRGIGNAVSP